MFVLAIALTATAHVATALDEPPPAQGTRLHFQKALRITPTSRGRIFAETHEVAEGETLKSILSQEYGIPEASQSALAEAFRTINPGVDPDRLSVGEVVQVPFKLEESLPGRAGAAPGLPQAHTVRRGESLWRILKNRYKVPREGMKDALEAVARANPEIRDLNLVFPGQRIVIPGDVAGPKIEPAKQPIPSSVLTVLDLLRQMNCQVFDQGGVLIGLSRGRSVKIEGQDFPIVTGPSGRRVVLDPLSRLSSALVRSIEEGWGDSVIQGTEVSAEVQLEKILPRLGFYELSRDERVATIGPGVELVLHPRWTVVPRPKDLWEGQVHLLFSEDSKLDPAVASLAVRMGFALHILGAAPLPAPSQAEELSHVPELPAADLARGAATLLDRLQIESRVRKEVDVDIGGGIRYRIQPELTFTHGGASYALPPSQPPRAEILLAKAGYLALSWHNGPSALGWMADLLALVGRQTVYKTVEVPPGQMIALRVAGLLVQDRKLAASLYPTIPLTDGSPPQVLLTEADLSPRAAAVFLQYGLRPWIVRKR